jgi:hypothetical protein
VTNRDKKDSIRGRMADTGEPFNVARRKVEAAAAGSTPESEDPWELIEVEVATVDKGQKGPYHRRHIETFWGRWVIEPDPEKTRSALPGHPEGAYYGVAQTRRGRIGVYMAMADPSFPARLEAYDTLDQARVPEDIRRQAAAVLGIREVIHRDI